MTIWSKKSIIHRLSEKISKMSFYLDVVISSQDLTVLSEIAKNSSTRGIAKFGNDFHN
jgi:hypothetical protein